MTRFAITALALICAAPAGAVELTRAAECITQARMAGTDPKACINAAHQPCLTDVQTAPAAATVCFNEAQTVWSGGIAARMTELRASVDDKTAARAGIELKYDLLGSLTQCDRLEELSRLEDQPTETVVLQKANCTASASALAYTRLLWWLPTPSE